MYGNFPSNQKTSRRRLCGCSLLVCLCTFCCLLFIIIGILVGLGFLLYRQPTIQVLGISPADNNSLGIFQPTATSLAINLTLNIAINNPNIIGATLPMVNGTGYSPELPNVPIANGSMTNIDIPAKSNTTIHFPFTLVYDEAQDSNLTALKSLLTDCGLTGQAKQNIPIMYKVDANVKVLFVTVNLPEFTGTTSFACPLPAGFSNSLLSSVLSSAQNVTQQFGL